MSKKELAIEISNRTGLSRADALKALDAALDAVADALKKGDAVSLQGFGTFKVKTRAAGKGFNPVAGTPVDVPAMNVIRFHASKKLADEIK